MQKDESKLNRTFSLWKPSAKLSPGKLHFQTD